MTISNTIPTDAVLVAIDIAKVCNEVLIEAPGGVHFLAKLSSLASAAKLAGGSEDGWPVLIRNTQHKPPPHVVGIPRGAQDLNPINHQRLPTIHHSYSTRMSYRPI